jgi:hypothetical protein
VGLAAVNGSATTAMRSDAAPPLDQAITPTWTGKHSFNQGLNSVGIVDVAAAIRSSGAASPTSGTGVEIEYNPGTGVGNIIAYDRTANAYKAISFQNSPVSMNAVLTTSAGIGNSGGQLNHQWNIGSSGWCVQWSNNVNVAGGLGCWFQNGATAGTNDTQSGYFQWVTSAPSAVAIGSISRNGVDVVSYNTASNGDKKATVHEKSERGLDNLRQIAVRDYYWRDDKDRHVTQGIYAQELQTIYPEAVACYDERDRDAKLTGDKYWGIDYGRLSPLAIRAIQELADKVDALQARLAELEGRR